MKAFADLFAAIDGTTSTNAKVDAIVRWGIDHCPVCDAVKRAVPLEIDIDLFGS